MHHTLQNWDQTLLDLTLETSPCAEEPQLETAPGVASEAALGRGQSPPTAAVIPRCHRDALPGAQSALRATDSAGISHCPGQEGKPRAAQAAAVRTSQELQTDLQIPQRVEGHKNSVHSSLCMNYKS